MLRLKVLACLPFAHVPRVEFGACLVVVALGIAPEGVLPSKRYRIDDPCRRADQAHHLLLCVLNLLFLLLPLVCGPPQTLPRVLSSTNRPTRASPENAGLSSPAFSGEARDGLFVEESTLGIVELARLSRRACTFPAICGDNAGMAKYTPVMPTTKASKTAPTAIKACFMDQPIVVTAS